MDKRIYARLAIGQNGIKSDARGDVLGREDQARPARRPVVHVIGQEPGSMRAESLEDNDIYQIRNILRSGVLIDVATPSP